MMMEEVGERDKIDEKQNNGDTRERNKRQRQRINDNGRDEDVRQRKPN